MNTNIIAQCDRNLSRLERVGNKLPDIIDNTALMIVNNPGDLAGRSIRLLSLLNGMRCQKNILAFFGDFLANEITCEKKVYTLGKKREGFLAPAFDPENMPHKYRSETAIIEAMERRIDAIKEKKAKEAKTEQACKQAQLEEQAKQDRYDAMEREKNNAINDKATLAESLKKANETIALLEKAPKAKMLKENKELQAEIARLKQAFVLEKTQWQETVTLLRNENAALTAKIAGLESNKGKGKGKDKAA